MAFIPLYDNAYRGNAQEVYRQIRADTYDVDLGQTGWMDAAELRGFLPLLELTPQSHVLEVGCGAGGCAMYLSQLTHAQVTGIDANASAIEEARVSAKSTPEARTRFKQIDASERLPFEDSSFDVVFSNDAMCHIPDRSRALKEWCRVLKVNGRMLFTDAMIVTGPITNEQLMTRSSIGVYVFLPPGENERLILQAGFDLIAAVDLTSNADAISRRWYEARARRCGDLVRIEGTSTFEGLQEFLSCVHTVSDKHLLSRFMYAARKPRSTPA
jgi:ubiquinone/menaquinone biosynthesis C-methylase UbiE